MPKTHARFVASLVVVCGGFVACGGGTGSPRGGTGGTTNGTGGAGTGTGGASTGTGGAGGAGVGFACNAMLAPNANITEFTDATAQGRWGTAPTTFTGGIFSYSEAGSTFTAAIDLAAHSFRLMGSVMGYAGGGLYFDLCTDASAYSGVRFTIAGDLGMCALELQVQTNSDKMVETNGMKGTCSTGCSFPSAKNLQTMITGAGPQTITVPFSAFTGGAPVAFSNKEVVGLQWQLTSMTSCSPNVTIDNVVWVAN
ncbi:MAG: hypothetical protein ABUL77_01975 [Bacteroidota bacterium]